MPSDEEYGPSIPFARLYERVSRNGNHYLIGRLGGAIEKQPWRDV